MEAALAVNADPDDRALDLVDGTRRYRFGDDGDTAAYGPDDTGPYDRLADRDSGPDGR